MSTQSSANLGLFSLLCELSMRKTALGWNHCRLLDVVYAGAAKLSLLSSHMALSSVLAWHWFGIGSNQPHKNSSMAAAVFQSVTGEPKCSLCVERCFCGYARQREVFIGRKNQSSLQRSGERGLVDKSHKPPS